MLAVVIAYGPPDSRAASLRACNRCASPALQDRVTPRRAAAQMRLLDLRQHVTAAAQQALDDAVQFPVVLQRAQGAEGDPRRGAGQFEDAEVFAVQDLAQILGERRHARGLLGLGGIVVEPPAVVLDVHAAAARRHHDRLDPGLEVRPHQAPMLRRTSMRPSSQEQPEDDSAPRSHRRAGGGGKKRDPEPRSSPRARKRH